MERALVSVIIPIYNQEMYLDRSIASVVKQSYCELEIIAVDDGSIDSSFEILERYKGLDNRIILIHKENGGLVDAVSVGIAYAHGDYICFLDPDDYLSEDYISNFVDYIEDYDVLACGFFRDSQGIISKESLNLNRIYNEKEITHLKKNFVDKKNIQVSSELFVARWNKIYRTGIVKEVLDEYKSFKSVSLGEDTIFLYLILCHCKKVKVMSKANGYYYNIKSQTSMMSNNSIDSHILKSKEAFIAFSKAIKDHNGNINNAYFLYYLLIESIFQRIKKQKGNNNFNDLYKLLHKDEQYMTSITKVIAASTGIKKISLIIRKYIKSGNIYLLLYRVLTR